jgi:hypothetical protein
VLVKDPQGRLPPPPLPAFNANEAVVANEDVTANDEVTALDDDTANDAVVVNELDTAFNT